MNNDLQNFYKKIESDYKTESNSWNLFPDFNNIPEEYKNYLRYEFYALNNFESDSFKEGITETRDQIADYFCERVKTTSNPHLLAKYYHFLLYVTRNNSFVSGAVKNYQKVLSHYLSVYQQGFHVLHFSETLEKLISISVKYKIDDNNLKIQIDNYLRDSSLSPKIKTFIFENIRDNGGKLFKSVDLADYPRLCIDLFNIETEHNLKERLLNLAVLFSQKTSDRDLFRTANELSGDFEYQKLQSHDDRNIAVSHMNEHHYKNIINHYKLAGQKEKQAKAIKELEENKKHHKFIRIQSKVPVKNHRQVYDLINEQIEALLADESDIFIYRLCFDSEALLFPPNEKIKNSVNKQIEQQITQQFLGSVLVDINNNTTSVSSEGLGMHQYYHIFLQNHTLPFLTELLKRAIDRRKLNYAKLRKALRKTAFGILFEDTRGSGKIEYSWFSLIDIGIQEFLKQFLKEIKQKPADWRFSVEFLSLKFEAILRDIIQFAGGEVTSVRENGDTELLLLDKLLDSVVIKEVFNEDDVFLFRHTFTKIGLNIRNNVAHGLYKPSDYTLSKAFPVFLSVLRLNKVTRYLVNKDDLLK
jgi:hypothetical protein